MSDLVGITVNGVEYVRADLAQPPVLGQWCIVVLPQGWVLVGERCPSRTSDYDPHETGFVLRQASVIRRWGTTTGLGELAEHGPTGENGARPPRGRFHPA